MIIYYEDLIGISGLVALFTLFVCRPYSKVEFDLQQGHH